MHDESQQFISEWERFIENLGEAAGRKLGRPDIETPNKQDLLNLFMDVTEELLSDVHLDEMLHISAQEDQMIVGFYRRELKYFNDLVENLTSGNVMKDDDVLDTGEKVKGSVDKLISKLPDRLKKLVHLLNELLKLVIAAV